MCVCVCVCVCVCDFEYIIMFGCIISVHLYVCLIIPLALMVGSGMVLTLPKDNCPACVSLSQRRSSIHVPLTLTPSDSGRRLEKLSAQDPKVYIYLYIYIYFFLFYFIYQQV